MYLYQNSFRAYHDAEAEADRLAIAGVGRELVSGKGSARLCYRTMQYNDPPASGRRGGVASGRWPHPRIVPRASNCYARKYLAE